MGTLNFFMKRTASAWPSRLRLKQPSRSAASESAPAAHAITSINPHYMLPRRSLLVSLKSQPGHMDGLQPQYLRCLSIARQGITAHPGADRNTIAISGYRDPYYFLKLTIQSTRLLLHMTKALESSRVTANHRLEHSVWKEEAPHRTAERLLLG